MTPIQALEIVQGLGQRYNEFDKEYQEAITLLASLITTPTQEEVCKKLSEFLEEDVKYEIEQYEDRDGKPCFVGTFYYGKVRKDMNGHDYVMKKLIASRDELGVATNSCFPPHLITLIGRFYESF